MAEKTSWGLEEIYRLPLPRLWRILDGFKKRADIQAGKGPEAKAATREFVKQAFPTISIDCLPLSLQNEIAKLKQEASRCRTT